MARTTIRTDDITAGQVSISDLSATGTPSSSNYLRGDGAWGEIASGGFNSVQVFTSSGTWTRPTGITKVIVYVTGGGGNGGTSTGNNYYAGSGAGAGGTAIKFLDVSSISSSTITVGAAGGASSWADGTNTITGNGGASPSSGSSSIPGTGGTATGGDINLTGGDGAIRYSTATGGQGGSSYWGGTDSYPTSGTPSAATTYGVGGSASSSGDAGGGGGGPGIVYVMEYK